MFRSFIICCILLIIVFILIYKEISKHENKKLLIAKKDVKKLPPPKNDIKKLLIAKKNVKKLPPPKNDIKNLPSSKKDVKNLPSSKNDVKNLFPPKNDIKNLPSSKNDIKKLPTSKKVGEKDLLKKYMNLQLKEKKQFDYIFKHLNIRNIVEKNKSTIDDIWDSTLEKYFNTIRNNIDAIEKTYKLNLQSYQKIIKHIINNEIKIQYTIEFYENIIFTRKIERKKLEIEIEKIIRLIEKYVNITHGTI